jgi:thioredoxin reductase (NADPH)
MDKDNCDLAIIGSGSTGLSAAIAAYSKNPEIRIKLFGIPFDSNTAKKGELETLPGISKIVGVDFIQQIVDQVKGLDSEFLQDKNTSEDQDFSSIEITNEMVKSVSKSDNVFTIDAEEKSIKAKSVIISTGLPELHHTIKGEDELVHKGVSHCAVCDGALYRGRKVVIIGTGNFVARGALFLRKYCRKVTLLCPDNNLNCDKRFLMKINKSPNITIKYGVDLTTVEIFGNQTVEGLKYQAENEMKELSVNGVFIELKDKPDLSIYSNLDLQTTDKGYIEVQGGNSTNVQGLFVAGTIKGELDYTPILIGDGYKAGIEAVEFLES